MPCKLCFFSFAIVIILYALMAHDHLEARKEIEYLGHQLEITNAKYLCAMDPECMDLAASEICDNDPECVLIK